MRSWVGPDELAPDLGDVPGAERARSACARRRGRAPRARRRCGRRRRARGRRRARRARRRRRTRRRAACVGARRRAPGWRAGRGARRRRHPAPTSWRRVRASSMAGEPKAEGSGSGAAGTARFHERGRVPRRARRRRALRASALDLEPDVGRALVDAPAVGERLHEVKAPAADVGRRPIARDGDEADALVDDLDTQLARASVSICRRSAPSPPYLTEFVISSDEQLDVGRRRRRPAALDGTPRGCGPRDHEVCRR